MKATELQIGDWILYGDKPVKVLQLSENGKLRLCGLDELADNFKI